MDLLDTRLPPTPTILACVDGSAYAPSVCDHATWLSSASGAVIDLLHVEEADLASEQGPALLQDAEAQIADNGGQTRCSRLEAGSFREIVRAQATTGGAIVMGKRGVAAGARRTDLGSNASALLLHSNEPLLLVSQLYLPVYRGLVLIDADPCHRRTVEFVATHPVLSALEIDVILMQPIGMDPEPKLTWARARLGKGDADVFPMQHGGPDEAAARYMVDHQVDIIVLSREMLFDQDLGLGMAFETRALWGWRTPLFIC
jgi:nucleotide-binding universal stress UspA family protein